MTFPVTFPFFGYRLHPHPVMELVAYTLGFQLFLMLRRRNVFPAATPPFEQFMWVIVGALFGAMFGSKLLAWLESPGEYFQTPLDLRRLLGGKTIVGGLLGGWAGVELTKKIVGIRSSTGDVCAFPLMVGMAVGRVGCFLTGLEDHTHGHHTSLPWGVDFGDGPRHPAQLYEIVFLVLLGLGLAAFVRFARPPNGVLFRSFLLGYLAFRFGVEFLKPTLKSLGGMSAIQIACLLGMAACVATLSRSGHEEALRDR